RCGFAARHSARCIRMGYCLLLLREDESHTVHHFAADDEGVLEKGRLCYEVGGLKEVSQPPVVGEQPGLGNNASNLLAATMGRLINCRADHSCRARCVGASASPRT